MVTFDMRPARRLLVNIPHMSSSDGISLPPLQSSTVAHAPPTAEQMRPGSPVYTPTAFDTNIVIITAALLVVLICALGMNTLIKCALNWTRRMAMESQAQDNIRRSNSTGIKKTELKLFPTAVYNEFGAEKMRRHGAADAWAPTQESQCPICLSEFKDGERIRVLPVCNHGFHIKCVDTWLYNHSSCPICRGDLSHAKTNVQQMETEKTTMTTATTSHGVAAAPAAGALQTAAARPPAPPAAQVQLQIVLTPTGSHVTPTFYKVITSAACPPGHDQLPDACTDQPSTQ